MKAGLGGFLSVLTDQTLGEINAMMLIDEFEVIGKPKAEAAHSLAKLPDLLTEKGFDLQFSAGSLFRKKLYWLSA